MAVSTKKAQGRPKGKAAEAASAGAQPPRDTFTLHFSLAVETAPGMVGREADVLKWMREAEELARIIEHPQCPDDLREIIAAVVGRVVSEQLFDRSGLGFSDPNVLRVAYPLALIALQGSEPATADGVTDTLYSVVHHMTPGIVHGDASERARLMYFGQQLAAEKEGGK